MGCEHGRRLLMVTPGLRMPCTFGLCDDCGVKLDEAQVGQVVKSWYPDRSLLYDYIEKEDQSAWHEATKAGRILFLYPGKLVTALLERIVLPSHTGNLYGKDFLA